MKSNWKRRFECCIEELANKPILNNGFAKDLFLEAFEDELMQDDGPVSCAHSRVCLYCAILNDTNHPRRE